MKHTNLAEYNNDWYGPKIGASRFKQFFWYFINIFFFKSRWLPFEGPRVVLLRLFGAHVGNNVIIKPGVNIKYPWKLSIGNYSWIGEDVWIDNLAQVTLGNNVCLSQGAMLLTGNHNFSKTTFDLIVLPIILEDGVWIGARSTMCPGVKAFSHAVLSVQSVATKNLEAYGVYQGNPAVKIKERIIG